MVFLRTVCTVNINAINTHVKKSLLRDFVWNNDIDVVFLQEVAFEDFGFLSSHAAIVNIGTEHKSTAVLVRKTVNFSNVIMNPNGRITSVVIDQMNFINVYAASGSTHKNERNDMFMSEIVPHISTVKQNVIVGDFNCVLLKSDSNSKNLNTCVGLETLVQTLQLYDVELKKNRRGNFTFIRGQSKSRLDRYYASLEVIEKVKTIATKPVAFSDHHAVVLKYQVPDGVVNQVRGRGYWKINPSILLNDNVCDALAQIYQECKTYTMYHRDINVWWNDYAKNRISKFFKHQNFLLNQQNHREKNFYYACLNEIIEKQAKGEDVYNEMCFVKSKLMEIEQNRLSNLGMKINSNSLLQDEKLSLFQLSSRIKRQTENSEFCLKVEGVPTTDSSRLKTFLFSHFSKVFEKENNENNFDDVLSHLHARLSDEDGAVLIRPIEKDELETVLKEAARKKTPGPDGLTYEFYMRFSEICIDDLLTVFNKYLIDGVRPSKNFTKGIISLIPKKGDPQDIANKRPISMLNADYKLFTKILANRLHPLLEKIIGPGQTACNPNKSCVDNLKTLRNITIRAGQTKRFKGLLLSLDLEKAFDKVNHSFLWAVLEKFGFPPLFINCLKNLYYDASSKITFNGFLTNDIAIRSSVRQGCPISMALFVLYIEPLIRMISDNIRGCFVANTFIKVLAYADDLNIFILNDHEFDTVLEIINYFSIYSKIKLNIHKSHYMRFNNCKSGPHQIQEKDCLKILGVVFHAKYQTTVSNNYDTVIQSVKHCFKTHSKRYLNLLQKVWIVNTFILSKIWYLAQVFPPNKNHLAQINASCWMFLWNRQIFKVSRNQMYLDVSKGGLSLIDPVLKCQALFVKNVLFSNNDPDPIDHFMMAQNQNNFLTLNSRLWLSYASEAASNPLLISTKSIYNSLLAEQSCATKIETENPDLQWDIIWGNCSKSFLSTNAREGLYMCVNDIVSSKVKQLRNKIVGISNDTCEFCGQQDTTEHRVKMCVGSKEIWTWIHDLIGRRFRLGLSDPEEIIGINMSEKAYKEKAALWLVCEAIAFNLKHFGKQRRLYKFQQHIRQLRWNNIVAIRKHFENCLNVF